MKTAIQDVLDSVKKRLNEFDGLTGFEVTMMKQELNWFKNILTNALEKEKQQSKDIFEHCWNHPNWNGEYDIKDMEDYLKTYNQNK
jgi:hypothetical protein